jgi:hypothetical protein
MTMHLHHPALTTTGKRKGKQKFASSEAKLKQEALKQEWEQNQKRWADMSKPRAMNLPSSKVALPVLGPPPGRFMASQAKSLDTGVTGPVTVKQTPHYTGNRLLGITILHKSCLQPVFSQEQAIEAAQMRR